MINPVITEGGMNVFISQEASEYENAIEPLIDCLDSYRGALFASSFEYPGRYTCWDLGFYNPPLELVCRQQELQITALNDRGSILLTMISSLLESIQSVEITSKSKEQYKLTIIPDKHLFSEEERSRQSSVFSVLRALLTFFKLDNEPYLGFYGAFGYDLIFQFEALERCRLREADQRDMVLYLPDEIHIVNHRKEEALIRRYDFAFNSLSTQDKLRSGRYQPYSPDRKPKQKRDHAPGEYAALVEKAKERFACGDLFEVVPSQVFFEHFTEKPSVLFRRMRENNPSPYGFLINLGKEEYIVGASPEMYVRVQGKKVETCPISGTIKRGKNAIEDAENIQTLLDSEKEASELTMCTDVDRNDKSRICEAGSVKVIGRRQIEMYSRLIHTVDHVEGTLREEFDALDAFLSHMWVVTVTGAPKLWAMNFIEKHEKSPRKWYAGAVGWLGFDGNLNTGLVLRTVRIKKGIAEIRAGATLLFDSEPQAEEEETGLKASAFLEMLKGEKRTDKDKTIPLKNGMNRKVLLIDHQDSFIHTLGNYIRQTGAEVTTVRFHHYLDYLKNNKYDLIVLSPGPGKPDDFNIKKTIDEILKRNIPIFGVCLGLQGIVEYYGARLEVLDYPMHGKSSLVKVNCNSGLFKGLSETIRVGRYHSLYIPLYQLPEELTATAICDDEVVMAVSHKSLPVHAVQFHPETILSLPNQAGIRIISNIMDMVSSDA